MADRYEIYVVMTDVTPVMHWEGPATDRVVRLALTPEQCAALQPKCVGRSGGSDIYETHSRCILQKVGDNANG